jgi:DNA repair exonuclease SbcCD ATPase subunit
VPSKLRSIDAEADIIKTNTAMIQSESIVYNKFIDEAKAESHCPLCKRELDSVEHFVDSLMVHLAEVPTRLKQYDEQIKSMYGVREQLSKLEAVWHDLQRVKGEIPRISEQIRQIDEDSMAIETKISECETDLQVAQAEEKRLHTVVQVRLRESCTRCSCLH